MHGVLLVDKSVSKGSTDVVRMVKKAFNTKKVGHTGTLDPFATGLLPICLGESLKYSRWLLNSTKTYDFTLSLGQQTDTADLTGETIAEAKVPVLLDISSSLLHFQGEISQIPPKFSALRVNGKRAYELAREGKSVELTSRIVTIHSLTLTQVSKTLLTGTVTVSKGTYIRTLCEDIAQYLGTVGHCSQLRRTSVSPFSIDHSLVLGAEELKRWFDCDDKSKLKEYLLPIDSLCSQFTSIFLSDAEIVYLRHGRRVPSHQTDGLYRIYDNLNLFVGLGEVQSGFLKGFRLMCH